MMKNRLQWYGLVVIVIMCALTAVGCSPGSSSLEEPVVADLAAAAETDEPEGEHQDEPNGEHEDEHDGEHEVQAEMLTLPALNAAELNGELLRVVATTSIIGDVVSQVGGETIDLTVLIGPGRDPHSYEPAAQDLTAVAGADVIFINGWNLEEGLVDDLENIGEDALIVPISADIVPLAFGDDGHDLEDEEHEEGEEHADDENHDDGDAHGHSGADPHVWFDIHNVEQWVENVEYVLSELDPANADGYAARAAAYRVALTELEAYAETQLASVPEENRFLVTNHDTFSYFAGAYGFTVLGTVIPGASTVAEPSASELADLIAEMEEHNVCAIFTETTVNDELAQTVAGELTGCDNVKVLKLYTGAVGVEGGGPDSYIGIFRANVEAIVSGLSGN